MIGILVGIGLVIGGIIYFIVNVRDAFSYDSPMAGLGIIFGCGGGAILGLLGIIAALIGLLLRK